MEKHHGVGIIVTDSNKDWFYIQQKDDTYPFIEYRLCYSFFGGAIEAGENELGALERELSEELEPEAAQWIRQVCNKVFDAEITTSRESYHFTLFEAVLPKYDLEDLAKLPVKEGASRLVSRKEINKLKFVHNLKVVLDKYLK
jgi:8-oxo-dGTP pyrophosphatase MutT (NUDIX family)